MSDTKSVRPCIFAGSEIGVLKAVDLGKRTAVNYYGPNELKADQGNYTYF